MPLTPFHLGPGLLIGLILFNCLDLPTFIVANVILDIEPFFVLTFGLESPIHGFFHSIPGGVFAALLLATIMFKTRNRFNRLMSIFKLEQDYSLRTIFSASLLGIYLHIFLDAFLAYDIKIFYPYDFNPLLNSATAFQVYSICILSSFAAVILYIQIIMKKDDN